MNLEEMKETLLDGARNNLGRFLSVAESPIEQAMLLALLQQSGGIVTHIENTVEGDGIPEQTRAIVEIPIRRESDTVLAMLIPQLEVECGDSKYRIDIAIAMPVAGQTKRARIAVECDGHDYHERTAAQAQRDKARDRDLQLGGWSVARFTGSEINRDPYGVANKVWEFCFRRAEMDAARWSTATKPTKAPKKKRLLAARRSTPLTDPPDAPVPIPMTAAEEAEVRRRSAEVLQKLREHFVKKGDK